MDPRRDTRIYTMISNKERNKVGEKLLLYHFATILCITRPKLVPRRQATGLTITAHADGAARSEDI